jgi:hypothetical protein
MLPTITNMAVTQYMLDSLFMKKTLRSQMLSGVIYDFLERGGRHGDIVFVRLSLLGHSLCNAFTKGP